MVAAAACCDGGGDAGGDGGERGGTLGGPLQLVMVLLTAEHCSRPLIPNKATHATIPLYTLSRPCAVSRPCTVSPCHPAPCQLSAAVQPSYVVIRHFFIKLPSSPFLISTPATVPKILALNPPPPPVVPVSVLQLGSATPWSSTAVS